jgi:hypothetical protein
VLGYTFSIESIYEGLHKISNAPLLKSTQSKILADNEKRKRIEAELEKQKENAAIEQEKFNQVKQQAESQMEVVEDVSVNSSEIVDESAINSPIENVSEPIVISEQLENTVDLESDKNKQEAFGEIETTNDSIESPEQEPEKATLTVLIFKTYLTKEQSKPKQKIWFELLDNYFPGKHDEITLESLLDKLDTLPEVKAKLLKAKKDKESIKSFFDAYK